MSGVPDLASIQLRIEFEDLLYYESELLSNARLVEWLDLLHEDIHYWIPVRSNRRPGKESLDRPYLMCHIDEDKYALNMRVQRIVQGFSVIESTAARSRHFVTNIRVSKTDDDNVAVTSNILYWRSQATLPDHMLSGCRHDRWTRGGDKWLLIERQVILDLDQIPSLNGLL